MSETELCQVKQKAATAGMLYLDAASDAFNSGKEKVGRALLALCRANTQAFKEVTT